MTVETGANPAAGGNTESPRDGDGQQAQSTDTSRNATDDAARDGRSDGEDDLDSLDDPARLREMLREMRKAERKRNEGYNNLQQTHKQTAERLAAIERERQAGAPLEDRVKQLEKDLSERDQRIQRMEQERKDERTESAIEQAARRLNAADPADVARLIDRDDLTIEDDGTPTNAEAVVRAFLKKKPHHLKTSAAGGADGGSRGSSGKGDGADMNSLLRNARRGRTAGGE